MYYDDRYLPYRKRKNFFFDNQVDKPIKTNYQNVLRTLIKTEESQLNVNGFENNKNALTFTLDNPQQYCKHRKVPISCYKVLDLPGFSNDFYSNVLDWSNNNVLAVSLNSTTYLWNKKLIAHYTSNKLVTALSWAHSGNRLAIGTTNGMIELYDVVKETSISSLNPSILKTNISDRIQSIAWKNEHVCAFGSSWGDIYLHDFRSKVNQVNTLQNHKSFVCGLKWSYNERDLASGSDDNKITIWNESSNKPIHVWEDHNSAIKALSWSPLKSNVLATGGGVNDHKIKIRKTNYHTNENIITEIDTYNQVCNLRWCDNNEIISTHGYTNYGIQLWKYYNQTLTNIASKSSAHTNRILQLAVSPENIVVTASSDETLRFWNLLPYKRVIKGSNTFDTYNTIR